MKRVYEQNKLLKLGKFIPKMNPQYIGLMIIAETCIKI